MDRRDTGPAGLSRSRMAWPCWWLVAALLVAQAVAASPRTSRPRLIKRGVAAWGRATPPSQEALHQAGSARLLAHAVADKANDACLKAARGFLYGTKLRDELLSDTTKLILNSETGTFLRQGLVPHPVVSFQLAPDIVSDQVR